MATRQIGKDTFDVSPLLGEASFLLQPKLAPAVAEFLTLYRLFAEAFVEAVGDDPKALDKEIDGAAALKMAGPLLDHAAPVMDRLCEKLTGDRLKEITRTLLQGATMNGTMLYTPQGNPIDVLLRGRTLDMWRLLIFALETSYPDFFAIVGALRAQPVAGGSSET